MTGEPEMVSVESLEYRLLQVNEERHALAREEVELRERIDALLLQERPTFPTAEMRAGMSEAFGLLGSGYISRSHLGDPTLTGGLAVRVGKLKGWGALFLAHRSPGSRRNGLNLWTFSDSEIETMLQLVRDAGFEIHDWWTSPSGVTVLCGPKEGNDG